MTRTKDLTLDEKLELEEIIQELEEKEGGPRELLIKTAWNEFFLRNANKNAREGRKIFEKNLKSKPLKWGS